MIASGRRHYAQVAQPVGRDRVLARAERSVQCAHTHRRIWRDEKSVEAKEEVVRLKRSGGNEDETNRDRVPPLHALSPSGLCPGLLDLPSDLAGLIRGRVN